MTDRIKGVWVAFRDDLREDDAEPVIEAIKQLRVVVGVTKLVANSDHWMARMQVSNEIGEEFGKLWRKITKS